MLCYDAQGFFKESIISHMKLTEEEIKALDECKTMEEFGQIENKIKAVRNGQYPVNWEMYVKIALSRILDDSKILTNKDKPS